MVVVVIVVDSWLDCLEADGTACPSTQLSWVENLSSVSIGHGIPSWRHYRGL